MAVGDGPERCCRLELRARQLSLSERPSPDRHLPELVYTVEIDRAGLLALCDRASHTRAGTATAGPLTVRRGRRGFPRPELPEPE